MLFILINVIHQSCKFLRRVNTIIQNSLYAAQRFDLIANGSHRLQILVNSFRKKKLVSIQNMNRKQQLVVMTWFFSFLQSGYMHICGRERWLFARVMIWRLRVQLPCPLLHSHRVICGYFSLFFNEKWWIYVTNF